MKRLFHICLLLSFLGCISCNPEQSFLDYTDHLNMEGKEIYFPPDIILSPCVKIFVYIDADCSSCFAKLAKWKELLQSKPILSRPGRVVFMLGTSNKLVTEYYMEKLNFSHPYAIDTTGLFLIENNLSDNRKHTLLLDATNHCILAGDPAADKKALKLFIKKL